MLSPSIIDKHQPSRKTIVLDSWCLRKVCTCHRLFQHDWLIRRHTLLSPSSSPFCLVFGRHPYAKLERFCKLTWLVGGDPAAGSHGVEQFTSQTGLQSTEAAKQLLQKLGHLQGPARQDLLRRLKPEFQATRIVPGRRVGSTHVGTMKPKQKPYKRGSLTH